MEANYCQILSSLFIKINKLNQIKVNYRDHFAYVYSVENTRCKSTNIQELVNWQSYELAMFRKNVSHDAGMSSVSYLMDSHSCRAHIL